MGRLEFGAARSVILGTPFGSETCALRRWFFLTPFDRQTYVAAFFLLGHAGILPAAKDVVVPIQASSGSPWKDRREVHLAALRSPELRLIIFDLLSHKIDYLIEWWAAIDDGCGADKLPAGHDETDD